MIDKVMMVESGSGGVAVVGWQWRSGRGKKMREIGRLLTEIRMIDKVMMVESGSGWVAVVGWQWRSGRGKKMSEIG
jgi:hypothetical protein